MNNSKILNDRWSEIDNKIAKFIPYYHKINKQTRDNIQDIFNSIDFTYEDLYKPANITYIAKLHRKISILKDKYKLNKYFNYILSDYERSKLKNNEVLFGLILIEYIQQLCEMDIEENVLFEEVSKIAYTQAQKEAGERKPNVLPQALITAYLGLPSYRSYKWKDYKNGNVIYQVRQLIDVVSIQMQKEKPLNVNSDEIKPVLDKQMNTYIKKKEIEPSKKYVDKYSGSLDDVICYLVNKIALEGMKVQGIEQVVFVAVLDDKTTEMCETLNGQKFMINELNTYQRYSKIDGRIVTYTTQGLETGANLPPINNHFHHCRSTIYPVK